MRVWHWILGTSVIGMGAVAVACSSSSSNPAGGEDGGSDGASTTDGGGEAAACTPVSPGMRVDTVDGGSQWACYNETTVCGSQLKACGGDCVCNNAVLTALACIVDAGGQTVSMTVKTNCFSAQLNAAGVVSDTAVVPLLTCLMGTGNSMCGLGGGEGGSDAPAGDAPTGDAPTGDAPTGDAPASDAPTGG